MLNKQRILAAQRIMVPLTLLVHAWVVIHGHAADGALWGTLYFVLFVYAEAYWAWRSFSESGLSPLCIVSALTTLWWLLLFAVYTLEKKKSPSGDGETSH